MVNIKHIKRTAILLIIVILITICRSFFWIDSKIINRIVNRIPQDALYWAHKVIFTPTLKVQQQLKRDYLDKYFSPWNKNVKQSLKKIRILELTVTQKYSKNPGYSINRQKHNKRWVRKIINNMNLHKIPNLNMKAITIEDANVRILPTVEPLFHCWSKPGEGYPFDYLQLTRVYANTPVVVLNISKDGEWYLIKASDYIGWIQNSKIAFVNNKFINSWLRPSYIVTTKDNYPIFDSKLRYRAKTHLAILYPLIKSSHSYYKVLIAIKSPNKYAKNLVVNMKKKVAAHFPLSITPVNIARIANDMLGQPYGWGGLAGYRDCSATIMDLFANFGIWLPRMSSDQIEIGKQILLDGLSDKQKEEVIINKGVPFLTLVHKSGHIMLYIGYKGKHVYILHNTWGLKTRNIFWQEDRAIIGRAVITPLKLAYPHLNVPKSLLSTIDEISVLYNSQTIKTFRANSSN